MSVSAAIRVGHQFEGQTQTHTQTAEKHWSQSVTSAPKVGVHVLLLYCVYKGTTTALKQILTFAPRGTCSSRIALEIDRD